MYSEMHGAKLIVEAMPGDPYNRLMVDCIDVIDSEGTHHPIRIYPGMSAAVVKDKIDELGTRGRYSVHFSISQANSEWFERIVEELWPEANRTEYPETQVGVYRNVGLIRFQVNDHYFRSLARIAFHYYLCFNKSGIIGREPEFALIRRFILDGGEPDPFFKTARSSPVYFGTPFGRTVIGGLVSPGMPCHILAADDRSAAIVAYVSLFNGRGIERIPSFVHLGETPLIRRVPATFGHMLAWRPDVTGKGTASTIEFAPGTRPPALVGTGLDGSDITNVFFTQYSG